ncbi:uncharacterized protein LOC115229719 [Octopus sinensis]|uniref:Uncharacterized protein LOC115229719 n=1 Tax=Octopus sinensis TaxID=2607531 RepID=A0A6P7TVR6_9MOLL|nr:uncharacterized protein LOC115229719 [Octopus sinensis]
MARDNYYIGLLDLKPFAFDEIDKFVRKLLMDLNTTILTELKIQYKKPDIFIYGKRENLIWLIEVGVTSIDNLKSVEVEKLHKYDILASELQLIHKAKVKLVQIVIT